MKRMEIGVALAIAWLFALAWTAGPWTAGAAQAGELAPGMSQHQVVSVLGPPTGLRLERNAVVCLTYASDEPWRARLFGERTRVIAFKEDRLVDDAIVRSVQIRFHCSRGAGQWDPPMRIKAPCDRLTGRC